MRRALRTILHVRRHPLGPRVYIAGLRVHECWAGLVAVVAVALLAVADRPGPHAFDAAVCVVAVWMMAKDWPDFFPSRRDTYSWRVGLHRRPGGREPHDASRCSPCANRAADEDAPGRVRTAPPAPQNPHQQPDVQARA